MWVLNPKRKRLRTLRQKIRFYVRLPFVKFGLWLGFTNVDYGHHTGYPERLKIGTGCSTVNTIFVTNCGHITVGDNTIFGHNCMVIAGYHRFYQGKRASLVPGAPKEVPEEGRDYEEGNDITIGSGCFLCSGSIVIKGVTIGDNVLLGAGSVVTKDIPSNCFACGVPAQVKRYFSEDEFASVVGAEKESQEAPTKCI